MTVLSGPGPRVRASVRHRPLGGSLPPPGKSLPGRLGRPAQDSRPLSGRSHLSMAAKARATVREQGGGPGTHGSALSPRPEPSLARARARPYHTPPTRPLG
jgi:hypothetical protein